MLPPEVQPGEKVAGTVSSLGIGNGSITSCYGRGGGTFSHYILFSYCISNCKMGGAIYLIYPGIKSVLNARKDKNNQNNLFEHQTEQLSSIYKKGIFVHLLHPKVELFLWLSEAIYILPGIGIATSNK